MRWQNRSGGIAARANTLLLLDLFCLLRLLRLLSHSILFVCWAAALNGRLRSTQWQDRLIRLALSANEPMILLGSGSTRGPTEVSFGSLADMTRSDRDVCFLPASGHRAVTQSQLRAMCGRLRVGKENLHERSIGRCGHVFGL